MHICYISSYYDQDFFEENQERSISLNAAIQKFNRLILQGLSAIKDCSIEAVSTVERGIKPKSARVRESLDGNEIIIKYAWNWNSGGIRNIGIMLSTFLKVILMPKDTVILSDVLKVSGTIGGMLAAKIRRFNTIGIVTDLPEYQDIASNKFMLRLNNWAIKKQDGYVFLTEAMNTKLNQNGKPYVVVEGFADEKMRNILHKKWDSNKKIVIYAGSLCSKYGICELVESFIKIAKDNEELWIFGDGDYSDKVKEISSIYTNIKYYGRQSNSVVVDSELQATLLVNPRTPEGEYTKYSFPSKTLEYMSTGTPVLMYRLPGIPDEYGRYLFFVSDKKNLPNEMRMILDKSTEELETFGAAAKNFVLSKKNSLTQSKKIVEMIRRMNLE